MGVRRCAHTAVPCCAACTRAASGNRCSRSIRYIWGPRALIALLGVLWVAAPVVLDRLAWWRGLAWRGSLAWRMRPASPEILSAILDRTGLHSLFDQYLGRGFDALNLRWALVAASWPVLVLLEMLIFRVSLRRAGARLVHVARAVVYAWAGVCALLSPLLVLLAGLRWLVVTGSLAKMADWLAPLGTGALLGAMLLLPLAATWRLARAGRLYLRLRHPEGVALSTWIITMGIWLLLLLYG